MLEFNGNDMTLTRGDTIYIDTVIMTPTGLVYEIQEGDKLTFSVYDKSNKLGGFEEKAVIQKEFKDRKLKIDRVDTAFLSKGTYEYRCVIEMNNEDKTKETYSSGKFILK
jgi:hypothetical protein